MVLSSPLFDSSTVLWLGFGAAAGIAVVAISGLAQHVVGTGHATHSNCAEAGNAHMAYRAAPEREEPASHVCAECIARVAQPDRPWG